MVPRKISSRPFVSRATRLLALERKLTVCPSALIEGTRLEPFAGDAPVPVEMLASTTPVVQVGITPRQVLRTKTFSTPFTVPPRFDASDENAMN